MLKLKIASGMTCFNYPSYRLSCPLFARKRSWLWDIFISLFERYDLTSGEDNSMAFRRMGKGEDLVRMWMAERVSDTCRVALWRFPERMTREAK